MSKFRFREYDALGLRKSLPGDRVASAHHISKRKQKQKDVEVVFDVKDYKEYVTGFRKRKQQRRQDAQNQIKQKERQERNQMRTEKRTKLRHELGLGDNYGVESSSDDDAEDADAKPQSVTVYQGEGGTTTTVTTMALHSSDDEQPAASEEGEDVEEEGSSEGEEAGPGPSSMHRRAGGGSAGGRGGARPAGLREARQGKQQLKGRREEPRRPGKGGRGGAQLGSRGGVAKHGHKSGGKKGKGAKR